MIALQSDVRVYLACGYTDMRKGMQGLAMLVQQVLAEDPFNGSLYAFRGRRGNLLKLVWHDGIGLIWPMTGTGSIALSAGQLSTLLEGAVRERRRSRCPAAPRRRSARPVITARCSRTCRRPVLIPSAATPSCSAAATRPL
jgi:transposase